MKKLTIISGFTLIEIMISIAILAILFAGTVKTMAAYHWMNRETYY